MPCSQALSNLMINFQAGVTDGCSRTVGNLIYTVKINFVCMLIFQCAVKFVLSLHVSIESIYFVASNLCCNLCDRLLLSTLQMPLCIALPCCNTLFPQRFVLFLNIDYDF